MCQPRHGDMATPVTSVEIGSPNRSLITLETGAIGGQLAEWTAFLRFDFWLSGPLVAIGLFLPTGPSSHTFLASLVPSSLLYQARVPQPTKSFRTTQVKIHSFSHSTNSIGPETLLLKLLTIKFYPRPRPVFALNISQAMSPTCLLQVPSPP